MLMSKQKWNASWSTINKYHMGTCGITYIFLFQLSWGCILCILACAVRFCGTIIPTLHSMMKICFMYLSIVIPSCNILRAAALELEWPECKEHITKGTSLLLTLDLALHPKLITSMLKRVCVRRRVPMTDQWGVLLFKHPLSTPWWCHVSMVNQL